MIEGYDQIEPGPGNTCTAVSAATVCPRCGSTMAATATDTIKVVASFACGCGRIDLSFLDLTHCQKTVWLVESCMVAMWGERGMRFAQHLLQPHVETFNRWRYGT